MLQLIQHMINLFLLLTNSQNYKENYSFSTNFKMFILVGDESLVPDKSKLTTAGSNPKLY
jgi:hypothetical protein